jgi:predicted nucleotidyltransferase
MGRNSTIHAVSPPFNSRILGSLIRKRSLVRIQDRPLISAVPGSIWAQTASRCGPPLLLRVKIVFGRKALWVLGFGWVAGWKTRLRVGRRRAAGHGSRGWSARRAVCHDYEASAGAGQGGRSAANCGSFEAVTTSEIVERAGRLLAEAAPPESRVILFGSHGRGEAGPDSDFDFLVIEPSVASKAAEMVRLRAALDPLKVAADVVVVASEYAEAWGDLPGTLIHDALTEGRVLAET